ncbi:unnamed protein product [Dovyalis caffra]|uniref:UBC core domain-containing protein n=1 Tax=Dovyalis caffra TaxID=77055 RepID=A0AAV1RW19_9ROSI|nr:unnamed protein product [Dovyalis caffra]
MLGAMIRLFKVKEKQRELAENANGGVPIKKQSAGELRLHKDISELNLPKSCTMTFPNGKDELMNFEVSIRPDEGYYLGGTFLFSFQVSAIYPHEAPKVKCKTKVYHPNIDLEGNVCLNILREDWKPVLNINTIIYGLYHLFTEPNYEDPLNHDAAAVLRDNPKMFESNVRRAMAGGYYFTAKSGYGNISRSSFLDFDHQEDSLGVRKLCQLVSEDRWSPITVEETETMINQDKFVINHEHSPPLQPVFVPILVVNEQTCSSILDACKCSVLLRYGLQQIQEYIQMDDLVQVLNSNVEQLDHLGCMLVQIHTSAPNDIQIVTKSAP